MLYMFYPKNLFSKYFVFTNFLHLSVPVYSIKAPPILIIMAKCLIK